MSTPEDELASRLRGLTLIEVSRALHEIADRLDESSRVAHQPTLADTRTGYYPDTDTESTTSSHDQRYSRSRHREGNRYPDHLEAEPHGRHVGSDPPEVARPHDHHAVLLDLSLLSAALPLRRQDRPDRVPRPASNYSEPRIRHHSYVSQSDSGRSARSNSGRSTRSDYYGRGAQQDHSPSPSPAPSQQVPVQPLQFPSEHQVPGVRTPSLANGSRLVSGRPPSPPKTYPDNPVLDDVFDLDESLVRRRTPDCDRTINHPDRGSQGSQGRWYIVCCGRKVGIFNEWSRVKKVTDGVTNSHQQRMRTEIEAYTYFKQALLEGSVEVAN